jgi:hypothetical protein
LHEFTIYEDYIYNPIFMADDFTIPIEKILEPRLVVGGRKSYIALIGANTVNYHTITTTSLTNTSVQFPNLDPPDRANTIVGQKMYVEFEMTFTFNATAGLNTGNILTAGCDGLRAFPISSCTRSLIFTINNTTIPSINLGDMIHARSRYFSHMAREINL